MGQSCDCENHLQILRRWSDNIAKFSCTVCEKKYLYNRNLGVAISHDDRTETKIDEIMRNTTSFKILASLLRKLFNVFRLDPVKSV